MTRAVDLNCDLGEQTGADDLALLDTVTSANIACGAGGGHAGDERTMADTVAACLARGVAIGAHPSYPDRAGFGRTVLPLFPDELERALFAQLSALDRIARAVRAGAGAIAHIKPHGALYHRAMVDEPTARAVADAATRLALPSPPIMIALRGSVAWHTWRALGFPTAAEAFADRAYEPDGSLRARTLPGALITDPTAAAAQAEALLSTSPPPDTLCIHSDTPAAPTIARAIRARLTAAGYTLAPLSRSTVPRRL